MANLEAKTMKLLRSEDSSRRGHKLTATAGAYPIGTGGPTTFVTADRSHGALAAD